MAKQEKTFNTKLYALVVFLLVAAILAVSTVATFSSKYIAFKPEKVAQAYADTIVQTGDGYNANKYALVSKSEKYGDFIRKFYMYPVIYKDAGYKPGDDTKNLKGLNDDSYKSDKTKNDNGTLTGRVTEAMYPYYVELLGQYGWDDADAMFTNYFAKYQQVRGQVFGDQYLDDEGMFTALEANVKTYGESLTGTEETYDKNTKVKLTDKTIGAYQKALGEDYKLTTTVTDVQSVEDVKAYTAKMNTQLLENYEVSADDISAVSTCTVQVTDAKGTQLATCNLTVVQIGHTWYVDNTTADTSALYQIGK